MTIHETSADRPDRGEIAPRPDQDAGSGRRARFAAWVLIVTAALSSPFWSRLDAGIGAIAGPMQSLTALTAMLWLLLTTPRNAIRLRWQTSAVVISLGAAGLPLMADGSAGAMSALVGAFGALLVLGLLLTPNAPMSPWWGVLILWRPGIWALWSPITGATTMLDAAGSRIGVLLAIIVVFGAYNRWSSRAVWGVWLIAAALELAAAAM